MRLVFEDVNEFKRWIETFVREDRHVIYTTNKKEVIILPKVSTQPVVSAYIKLGSMDDIVNVLPINVPMFHVKYFDWKDDTPVGTSFFGD